VMSFVALAPLGMPLTTDRPSLHSERARHANVHVDAIHRDEPALVIYAFTLQGRR
jgi:hypothetical protein